MGNIRTKSLVEQSLLAEDRVVRLDRLEAQHRLSAGCGGAGSIAFDRAVDGRARHAEELGQLARRVLTRLGLPVATEQERTLSRSAAAA